MWCSTELPLKCLLHHFHDQHLFLKKQCCMEPQAAAQRHSGERRLDMSHSQARTILPPAPLLLPETRSGLRGCVVMSLHNTPPSWLLLGDPFVEFLDLAFKCSKDVEAKHKPALGLQFEPVHFMGKGENVGLFSQTYFYKFWLKCSPRRQRAQLICCSDKGRPSFEA